MKKNLFLIVTLTAVMAIVGSCKKSEEWKVRGDIQGARNETVVLEASYNGNWYVVDSVRIKNNGSFEFKQPKAAYPAIYRLAYNGKYVYFPIDSTETVTMTTNFDSFDQDYVLSGSTSAENLMKANSLISHAGSDAASNDSLKKELGNIILSNPADITSFYIINSSSVSGKPIFDPKVKSDLRIIGAVANAYNDKRPDDPRTDYLKNLYIGSKNSMSPNLTSPSDTLVIEATGYPEIELLDENGKKQVLSEIANGHPVLVSFTQYLADYSPTMNVILGEIYEKYKDKGLRIYQIGIDDDEFEWRRTARNLPWTTVYNSPKDGASYLLKYNVGQLPMTYIIDRNGDLVERIVDPTELSAALGKHM